MLSAIWLLSLAISSAVSLPSFGYLMYSTDKDVTSTMFRFIVILVLRKQKASAISGPYIVTKIYMTLGQVASIVEHTILLHLKHP